MIELYSERQVEKTKLVNRIWAVAISVFALACLAACITLCCMVNVRNVTQMMIATMSVAVVGGWIVIYVIFSVIVENKHEIVHAKNMLEGERTEHTGELTLSSQKIKIAGSITIVKATLSNGAQTERFNVNLSKVKSLKGIKGMVKLYAVHGYAFAFEVCDENN